MERKKELKIEVNMECKELRLEIKIMPAEILARHVKVVEETFPPRMEPEKENDEEPREN